MIHGVQSHDAAEVGIPERSVTDQSVAKVGAFEARAVEICADEVGVAEVRISEVCTREVSVHEVCAPETSIFQGRAGEVCSDEVGIDRGILIAPFVPRLNPLSQNLQVLRVSHLTFLRRGYYRRPCAGARPRRYAGRV